MRSAPFSSRTGVDGASEHVDSVAAVKVGGSGRAERLVLLDRKDEANARVAGSNEGVEGIAEAVVGGVDAAAPTREATADRHAPRIVDARFTRASTRSG
ncbi:MAG: hypothetical protein R3B99_07760 [Polyangiales bacterium]